MIYRNFDISKRGHDTTGRNINSLDINYMYERWISSYLKLPCAELPWQMEREHGTAGHTAGHYCMHRLRPILAYYLVLDTILNPLGLDYSIPGGAPTKCKG